jgi:uncharacterized membrane protein
MSVGRFFNAMTTAALAAGLAGALAACDPHSADSTSGAQPPADAPTDAPAVGTDRSLEAEFGASFRLVGTEPFWSLRIGQTEMVLSRPGQPDFTVARPAPQGRDGQATWAVEGLSATVTRQACSDGMSDRAYHYAARVRVGTQTLKGCADGEAWFAP